MTKKKNTTTDAFTGLILGVGFTIFLILVTFGLLSFFFNGEPTPLNYDRVFETRIALGEIALKFLAFGGVFILLKTIYSRSENRINNTQSIQSIIVTIFFVAPYVYYYYFYNKT